MSEAKTTYGKPAVPLKDVQFNVRIPDTIKLRFAEECTCRRASQSEIITTLLTVWLDHAQDVGVRHLNGTECPISQLVRTLAESARIEMSNQRKAV